MKTDYLYLYINAICGLPLVVAIVLALLHPIKESLIYRISFWSYITQCIVICILSGTWFFNAHPGILLNTLTLYRSEDYQFYLTFQLTIFNIIFLSTGTILCLLITVFSKRYLHRETGYKRFFASMHLFYFGFIIVTLSGNLETLFMGWEILGICSFLLIAFYRTRFLPVHNALRAFTVYRLGDIGLILSMWGLHHTWHTQVNFENIVQFHPSELHYTSSVFIAVMLLLAAMAKSALFPFTTWLPRAMEGPTPSSVISYGALSVHMGILLLIKTYAFWQHLLFFKILLFALGVITAVISTLISNTQSTIKGRIAYATAAQIGIMCVELSCGWIIIAMLHVCSHAFLRSYQLLRSASIVSLKNTEFKNESLFYTISGKKPVLLHSALYVLALKEFNMDVIMYTYFWKPLKTFGRLISIASYKDLIIKSIPILGIGLLNRYSPQLIPTYIHNFIPVALGCFGLALILKAFSATQQLPLLMTLILSNHLVIALAISINETLQTQELMFYLGGVVTGFILCFSVLLFLKSLYKSLKLNDYNGLVFKHPKAAFVFLIGCLMLSGFPISTTFIGEDLIFSHIKPDQALLVFIISVSFIIDGLALVRLYARLFLGPISQQHQLNSYKRS